MAEDKTTTTEETKEVKANPKFAKLIEEISNLTALELSELVKELEEVFGVSASAPMMMAGAPAAGGGEEAAETKNEFNISLESFGEKKIDVIKIVRELTGQGLGEAKSMVESAPVVIKEAVKAEEAEEIKTRLTDAGATVELK